MFTFPLKIRSKCIFTKISIAFVLLWNNSPDIAFVELQATFQDADFVILSFVRRLLIHKCLIVISAEFTARIGPKVVQRLVEFAKTGKEGKMK